MFSFDDVLPLAATAGKTDPDDIPETPKNPVSRVGDIWTLGKHRLMCGDATKPAHRLRHRDRARLRGRDGDTVGRLHGPEGRTVDKVTSDHPGQLSGVYALKSFIDIDLLLGWL